MHKGLMTTAEIADALTKAGLERTAHSVSAMCLRRKFRGAKCEGGVWLVPKCFAVPEAYLAAVGGPGRQRKG